MIASISRRKLSDFYASSLIGGVSSRKLAMELAAYLVESKRTKELSMIISDIEYQLGIRGVVVAKVTSAHSLDEIAKESLVDFIRNKTGAKQIHLRENIDSKVLGGVKLEFVGNELDTTISRKLTKLKTNRKY